MLHHMKAHTPHSGRFKGHLSRYLIDAVMVHHDWAKGEYPINVSTHGELNVRAAHRKAAIPASYRKGGLRAKSLRGAPCWVPCFSELFQFKDHLALSLKCYLLKGKLTFGGSLTFRLDTAREAERFLLLSLPRAAVTKLSSAFGSSLHF